MTIVEDVSLLTAPTRSTGGRVVDDLLHGAERLWLGEQAPGLQVRLFRRKIHAATLPSQVELRITAESYFHLWVNGRFITRGPVFHHTGKMPVARIDLTSDWRVGENTIAVLVYAPGFPTHMVPTTTPGLWAAVRVRDHAGRDRWTISDSDWLATARVGWAAHAIRHGWGLGPVEVLDAEKHPFGWEAPAFDDADWLPAKASDDRTGFEFVEVPTPSLRFGLAPVWSLLSVWSAAPLPAPLAPQQRCEVLGEWLDREPWTPLTTTDAARWDAERGELAISDLRRDEGRVVVLDFGHEVVGNLAFECETASRGVLEIGWSEVLRDGRPEVVHKGTTYVDRLLARPGVQQWDALQFTGLRYVALILRGFEGAVTIRNVGVRTSTSAPPIEAEFHCDDEKLNAVWRICTRTLELGTQETLLDCPSREQAPYLGDGHLVGQWLGAFTGDYRHWRYLISLGFDSQAADGLLRDAPLYPVHRSLIDYVLLSVVAVLRYLDLTGDESFVRSLLPNCRRAVGYFDARLGDDHILNALQVPGVRDVPWDVPGPARVTKSLDPHLFIDHPGLGGHNVGDPGIERHGRSAALTALYVLALDALAELERRFGRASEATRRSSSATRIRAAAAAAYWNPHRAVFVDAIDAQRQQSAQISEQTNILALLAGWDRPVSATEVLRRVMSPDPAISRAGSYFTAYLLPLMAELGLHADALSLVREKWGRMVDGGATTLWETFAGDCMDTWCHAWSAAPAPFLIREVLGLRGNELADVRDGLVTLRPRYDLLRQASGRIPTVRGPMNIGWNVVDRVVQLRGGLPDGMSAVVWPCGDHSSPVEIRSQWSIDWPASECAG